MLRIHFSSQDLDSIRLARHPDPLWEIVCSLCRLQSREGRIAFDPWRRAAARRIGQGGHSREAALALRRLVPHAAYFPDFLTPPLDGGITDLRSGIDRVLSTPRRRLRTELGLLAPGSGGPFAGQALARGDVATLAALGGSLRTYHETFIAPGWSRIGAAVAADIAWRTRAVATGGTRALLDTFRPMARWRPPVLEVDYPVPRELHLNGRGLLLVPSYFCWRRPITLVDESLLPVLVYPIDRTLSPAQAATPAGLVRLLGPTRSALLAETAALDCRTTSELAAAVGISLPTASQQLAVLCEAGLTTRRKEGRHVLYNATPLGLRLLGG